MDISVGVQVGLMAIACGVSIISLQLAMLSRQLRKIHEVMTHVDRKLFWLKDRALGPHPFRAPPEWPQSPSPDPRPRGRFEQMDHLPGSPFSRTDR